MPKTKWLSPRMLIAQISTVDILTTYRATRLEDIRDSGDTFEAVDRVRR